MIDQVSRLQVSSISTVTDQGLSWKLLFLNLEKYHESAWILFLVDHNEGRI